MVGVGADMVGVGVLHGVSLVAFYHDFDITLAQEAGVCANGVMAFDNAVLDVCVVPYVYVIQDNGVLDDAIVSDIAFLEYHGILHGAVYDTAAGYQAVLDIRTHVVLGRRKVVHLGVNIGVLFEEIIAHLRL